MDYWTRHADCPVVEGSKLVIKNELTIKTKFFAGHASKRTLKMKISIFSRNFFDYVFTSRTRMENHAIENIILKLSGYIPPLFFGVDILKFFLQFLDFLLDNR